MNFKSMILKTLNLNEIIAGAIQKNNKMIDDEIKKHVDELKQELTTQINSKITALTIDIDEKIEDKYNSISESVDTIADLISQFTNKIKNISDQQETDKASIFEQFVILNAKLSKELSKTKESISTIRSNLDESKIRLDAFIDVISEKITAQVSKRTVTESKKIEPKVSKIDNDEVEKSGQPDRTERVEKLKRERLEQIEKAKKSAEFKDEQQLTEPVSTVRVIQRHSLSEATKRAVAAGSRGIMRSEGNI